MDLIIALSNTLNWFRFWAVKFPISISSFSSFPSPYSVFIRFHQSIDLLRFRINNENIDWSVWCVSLLWCRSMNTQFSFRADKEIITVAMVMVIGDGNRHCREIDWRIYTRSALFHHRRLLFTFRCSYWLDELSCIISCDGA